MKIQRMAGLVAAAYTPMHPDGSVHIDPIKDYYEYLRRNNITGVFINGTTGEGIMLTTEERKKVAESWLKHAQNDLTMIIHIGGPSIETCKELAAHAAVIGADAISIMGPNFFKPAGVKELVGLKFTHFDLMEFSQCLMAENAKFDVMHGHDEILLCGLVLGAQAAVGSTYNLMPGIYFKLME